MLSSDNSNFKSGRIIAARYEVIRCLGYSDLWITLLAKDNSIDESEIVLKCAQPSLLNQGDTIDKIQKNVLLNRQLSQPNILRTYDSEKSKEGIVFITREYVDGLSLRELLDSNTETSLTHHSVIKILVDIAKGLKFAHQQGILHLNLKPENILISYDGQVKVSDFGITAILESDLGLTLTGESPSAPPYMAPEQFRNAEVCEQTDIYSLGIIAYELLSGALPFSGDNYLDFAEQHLHTVVEEINCTLEDVPTWLLELVFSCIEKSKEKRPVSAAEFISQVSLNTEVDLDDAVIVLNQSSYTSRINKRWVKIGFVVFILAAFFFALPAFVFQNKNRRPTAKLTLQLEQALGVELRNLKTYLEISSSLEKPMEIFPMIAFGDYKSAQALLDAGLDPNLKNEQGESLLHYMAKFRRFEAIRALPKKMLDIHARDKNGNTAAHAMVEGGWDEYSYHYLFLPRNLALPLEAKNNLGQTPLHHAVEKEQSAVVEGLLKLGANPDSRDNRGSTPLMHIINNYNSPVYLEKITDILLEYGASHAARDNNGKSALNYATELGLTSIVDRLLQAGAEPESAVTAPSSSSIAQANGHTETLELLSNYKYSTQKSPKPK